MATTADLKARLRMQAARVEGYLATCLAGRGIPPRLQSAMEYSLLAGGKRLRPVLCLSTAGMTGLDPMSVMPFAAAIELIHTYSLIHDDLPAMDDDDLRRGRPSNHRQFDEATAILAGDGLLTDAFDLMASVGGGIPAGHVLAALREVSSAAGASGMVGGQALDMDYTGRDDIDLAALRTMHAMKTGALIRCSCVAGALLGGAPASAVEQVAGYGAAIGAAFQIVDDILDETGDEAQLGKPVGSDVEQGKVTYPSLLGIERSRALAQEQADIAVTCLADFEGEDADFLRALAQYIVDRVS